MAGSAVQRRFCANRAAAEFDELEQRVLGPLWDKFSDLGCNPVLLAVPGNHDLERPDGKSLRAAVTVLKKPGMFSGEVAEEFWNDPKCEYRRVIDKAFANYSAWWGKRPCCANQVVRDGLLPGDFSTTFVTDEGRRIGVVGLNSTFLQLAGDDYKGRLACDIRQLHAVCPPDAPTWIDDHDVRLLMTHQGPDWFDQPSGDNLNVEINPAGSFAVHLFGHMHEENTHSESSGGAPLRRFWQGPSLFGMEHYGDDAKQERVHGYTVGSIQFDAEEIILRHWPRIAIRDSSGWRVAPDHEHCRLERDEGTRPDSIALQQSNPPESTMSDNDALTDQLLSAYHQKVKKDWDDRWSRVITDAGEEE